MHEPPFLSPHVPPERVLAATVAATGGTAGHKRRLGRLRAWFLKLTDPIRRRSRAGRAGPRG